MENGTPLHSGQANPVMVTKVLLTLLVIVVAYIYLRRRVSASQSKPGPVTVTPKAGGAPIRVVAVLFLLISFSLTLGFFVYRWIDGNQLLRITLTSPQSPGPVYYQVHKSELQERSFTTTDGQIIRISAQDRLVIESIPD